MIERNPRNWRFSRYPAERIIVDGLIGSVLNAAHSLEAQPMGPRYFFHGNQWLKAARRPEPNEVHLRCRNLF
jgi:hypothetical protein